MLILMAITPPSKDKTAPLEDKARQAVKLLDQCLIEGAERLRSSPLDWEQKYQSYRQSCSKERSIAFDLALRDEWIRSMPRNPNERASAYGRATFRIDSRFDIWVTRFLDPKSPVY